MGRNQRAPPFWPANGCVAVLTPVSLFIVPGRGRNSKPENGSKFVVFHNVTLRSGERAVFPGTSWSWRDREQWGLLGNDDSGKSLFIQALLGRAVVLKGEITWPLFETQNGGEFREPTLAHVSPDTQRQLAASESSFYQLRWHSGLDQGQRTVADYLSQASVEEHNPFEVGAELSDPAQFLKRRRFFSRLLELTTLRNRKVGHLSNGETRKVLLAYNLLKSPDLLVLEDALGGLDFETRTKVKSVISRLMGRGLRTFIATGRAEEIPRSTTHLLIARKGRIIAQGPRRAMLRLWRSNLKTAHKQAGHVQSPRRRSRDGRPSAHREHLAELRDVTVTATGKTLLYRVNWTLRKGECWALLGRNGAGKTTLLNLLTGDHPQVYSANIRLFGRPTSSTQAVWAARQFIGWTSPELHQLYPASWTAEQVVCSGYFGTIGLYNACSAARRTTARRWLRELGLAGFEMHPFGELTFAQQRLALLARAVVKTPRLLILDEPNQGLDARQKRTLLNCVERIVARTGTSLIFVTHHTDELPRCISHVLLLANGRVDEVVHRRQPSP